MKTLPAFAFIAALGAFLFFPLSFEIAGSALFAAGFAAIALCDYSRRARPLQLPAVAAVVTAEVRRTERFGLAA
jgi:hypothetical protein